MRDLFFIIVQLLLKFIELKIGFLNYIIITIHCGFSLIKQPSVRLATDYKKVDFICNSRLRSKIHVYFVTSYFKPLEPSKYGILNSVLALLATISCLDGLIH